jgi:signal transduction histidine kinase
MFASIRARLWLSYAALIAIALALVILVLTVFMLRNPLVYRQTYLRLQAAQSALLSETVAAGRVGTVAQAFGVRVLRYSASGDLLEDSGGDAAIGPARPVLAGPPQGVLRDGAGRLWLYSRARAVDGTWLLAAARRPRLLPALGLLTDELWRPVLEGGLVALVLSLLLAYFLARWIGDPLQRLVMAARAIFPERARAAANAAHAGSDKDIEDVPAVMEQGPAEVRALTRTFNAMVARVLASQRSQREFVANVSHELKTPLTSIQGFAQALIDGAAETPEARRQAAEIIYDAAGRMHRLSLELLDLARLDSGTADMKIGEVDLEQLLESVVRQLRPMAATAGVSLSLASAGNLRALEGDGDRLAQVFINLVDNALKFTPRGGSVALQVTRQKDQLRVAVVDSGPGIAAGDIPHIFDRFYQADSARGGGERHGTGLGLAIAREIIQAHGGTISVRSAPDHGAEFIVYLPAVDRRQ